MKSKWILGLVALTVVALACSTGQDHYPYTGDLDKVVVRLTD